MISFFRRVFGLAVAVGLVAVFPASLAADIGPAESTQVIVSCSDGHSAILWLDAAALIRGDLPRVHEVLHQGLASPDHAAFVARLNSKATPGT